MTVLATILGLLLSGNGFRVVASKGGVVQTGDTLELSLAVGDTAILQSESGQNLSLRSGFLPGAIQGSRVVLAPVAEGSRFLKFGRFLHRSQLVRLDVLPSRKLAIGLRGIACPPFGDSVLAKLELEVDRILSPLRVTVSIASQGFRDVPRGGTPFWDSEGDGFLDLRRNMDSARPDLELDSLVRWIEGQGVKWPDAVVVGLPTRTGWTLGQDMSPGDSVLVLARKANLPWRDETGALRTYRIASRRDERADTFQVVSYKEGTHRIRVRGTPHPHPSATDWVTLPGFDPGAFGFTPWWRQGSPILVFPAMNGRLSERTLARILAREVARGLGLPSDPNGNNLMCPMVRPDVNDPALLPSQWRILLPSTR